MYFGNLISIARSFMLFVLWLHTEFLKLQSYFPATPICCLIWSKKCSKPWFPGLWQADHFRVCHGQSPHSNPTSLLIQQDRKGTANSSGYTTSHPTCCMGKVLLLLLLSPPFAVTHGFPWIFSFHPWIFSFSLLWHYFILHRTSLIRALITPISANFIALPSPFLLHGTEAAEPMAKDCLLWTSYTQEHWWWTKTFRWNTEL